jgi:hypothetical protein
MDWSSRGTVLTLLLWSFAGAADADDVFEHPVTADQILKGVLVEPVALINGAQVIRGQFVYKRFLSELPAPLESTGEYLFVKDLGIAWHTEQPFDSEFIVTAAGTTQRDDGKVTLQTSTDEPAADDRPDPVTRAVFAGAVRPHPFRRAARDDDVQHEFRVNRIEIAGRC